MIPVAKTFSEFTTFSSLDISFGLGCSHQEPLPPGNVFGPTTSKHYVIEYVHTGRGVLDLNGELYHMEAGDFYIGFPWQVRTQYADKDDPWGFSWVNLSGKSADLFFELTGITHLNPVIHACSDTKIPGIIVEICRILENDTSPQHIFRSGALVMSLFDEIWQVACSRGISTHMQHQEGYVERAAKYMETHFDNKNLTIDSVAHTLGLNRSYLYKLFKSEIGMSPQEFLMKLRITKGVELLTMSNTKITTIAYSVGYEPLIFTKIFKKFTGVTPSEYRKVHGKK